MSFQMCFLELGMQSIKNIVCIFILKIALKISGPLVSFEGAKA